MSRATPFVSAMLSPDPTPPCDPDEFLFLRETFSGGTPEAYWNDNQNYAAAYTPNTAQILFPTAASVSLTPPSGNTYLMNYAYKNAAPSDNTANQVAQVGTAFTEFYVTWNEYYSSGFLWPQSQKLLRVGNATGLGPTIDFVPISTNGNPNQALTLLGYDAATTTTMFGGVNCPMDGFIPAGEWVKMEFYFRKATAPNVADGACWARIGDVVTCNRGAVITHTTADKPYNFIWIGGNNTWNGTGPGGYTAVPQNQNRYIDGITLYSQVPCDVTPP